MINSFFDCIFKQNYLNIQRTNIDHKKFIGKSTFLSAFIRCNFIEPLIFTLTQNEEFTYRYRYHVISLFEMEMSAILKKKCNVEIYKFIRANTWWICVNCNNSKTICDYFSDEKINLSLLALHSTNNIDLFIMIFQAYQETHKEFFTEAILQKNENLKKIVQYCNDKMKQKCEHVS